MCIFVIELNLSLKTPQTRGFKLLFAHCTVTKNERTNHLPDKICDDEQLHDPVDDPHRPTLHNHRLGGLVGEEASDQAPRNGGHGCLLTGVTGPS